MNWLFDPDRLKLVWLGLFFLDLEKSSKLLIYFLIFLLLFFANNAFDWLSYHPIRLHVVQTVFKFITQLGVHITYSVILNNYLICRNYNSFIVEMLSTQLDYNNSCVSMERPTCTGRFEKLVFYFLFLAIAIVGVLIVKYCTTYG